MLDLARNFGRDELGCDPFGMWWTPRELGSPALCARLGELVLWFRAEPGELILHTQRNREASEVSFDHETPPADADPQRFVLSGTPTSIELLPRLVDRSVVARPRVPMFLPPREKVTLFVTSPLQVLVKVEKTELVEIPIADPPETWFGPSPVDGELCFASRTRGTRSLDDLDAPTTRVVTQVQLENAGTTTLEVKSIRLPMLRLSLAWDEEHAQLVTETVRLTRDDDDQAELHIEPLPRSTERLAPPRDPSRAVWKQALAALWS